MYSEDAEDQEVFEITDFTTASEWERFVAQLEEVIREWKLPSILSKSPLKKGELISGQWEETTQKIQFADVEFKVTRYFLKQFQPDDNTSPTEEGSEEDNPQPQALKDMMSMENDFPSRAHSLCRWYGLRDFVVLQPPFAIAITSESRVKILLSALCMAVNNTNCHIPMFIQVHKETEKFYVGVCEGGGVRTDFQMVHLKHMPTQYSHLAGLLDVFKSKLSSPVPLPAVMVTVRFTYILNEWTSYTWTQEPPDFDVMQGEIGFSELGRLPFGACQDPVSELHLSAVWPCLPENMVVDSDIHSDLEPLQAPHWSVRMRMANSLNCLLSENLIKFISLCQQSESMEQVLGHNFLDDSDTDTQITTALERLTQPIVPDFSTVVGKAHKQLHLRKISEGGPISRDLLIPILNYLFPDAEENKEDNQIKPYPSNLGPHSQVNEDHFQPFKEQFNGIKSSPIGGLVWRLAVTMTHAVHSLGGLSAAAHLWHEVVLELRHRWENSILLPGVEPGSPNHGLCLLHQKLQMLNCCIEKKRSRENLPKPKENEQRETEKEVPMDTGDSSEEDDEFYECEDETDPGVFIDAVSVPCGKKQRELSLWNQPVGRLCQFGDLTLMETGDPLYVPFTQEPAPMTEDQLQEHAEVLIQLGTDAQGAELRARMMSACLLSDMESFKAANPGSNLVDFVRWYSPRDWIEEEGVDESGQSVKGHLSARMQLPGNIWQEVWQNAKPVPARRQKRLFDDTKEAEKVLHYFASLKPGDVAYLLLPTLVHAAICRILEEKEDGTPTLSPLMEQILKKAAKISQSPRTDKKHYEELIKQLTLAETAIAHAQSLRWKFVRNPPESNTMHRKELEEFVSSLLTLQEVPVIGAKQSAAGKIIHKMFAEAQRATHMILEESADGLNTVHPGISSFPQPAAREFILRTVIPRPAVYSIPTPQRMFCVLMKDDYRLAGAFSQDTKFQ